MSILEECLSDNESGAHELEKRAANCVLCTVDQSADLCIGNRTSLVWYGVVATAVECPGKADPMGWRFEKRNWDIGRWRRVERRHLRSRVELMDGMTAQRGVSATDRGSDSATLRVYWVYWYAVSKRSGTVRIFCECTALPV